MNRLKATEQRGPALIEEVKSEAASLNSNIRGGTGEEGEEGEG